MEIGPRSILWDCRASLHYCADYGVESPRLQARSRTADLPVARFRCPQIAATIVVRSLCYLRAVLDFIDGESDHRWERLRRADCSDLRCAREPQPVGFGRAAAWWAAFHDHACRKLSRFPGRHRWPGADSEYAQT